MTLSDAAFSELVGSDVTTNRLVDDAYAMADEPLHYDDFMASWERYVEEALTRHGDLSSEMRSAIDGHFNQALRILDQLGRLRSRALSGQELVDDLHGFGVIVSASGLVIAANRSACVNDNPPARLRELPFNAAALARIQSWLAAPEGSVLLQTVSSPADERSRCFMVSRIREDVTTDDWFLISGVELRIDERQLQPLQGLYELSDAELSVATALANGANPAEVAEQRGAALNTVRTQIKRILKKTAARGIPDLVRLLCGFSANTVVLPSQKVESSCWSRLRLRDGRQLSYLQQGSPSGTPVLFLHNMLYGVGWNPSAIEACVEQGFRVIAPSRPGFGESDLNASAAGADLVDATCDDVLQLLHALAVEKTIVIGHAAGSIYAQRFALNYPDKVDALLFISHVPVWDESFMPMLPRRQRIVARTTRLARSALPFVTRAGVALIDAGREDVFLGALHHDIPEDVRALRRPDVRQVVVEGLRHTVRRGPAGFCADCPLVLTDWREDAKRLTVPIYALQGEGDQVVSRCYIEAYEEATDIDVSWVAGAGQFLLLSHWPQVLRTLGSLRERHCTQM